MNVFQDEYEQRLKDVEVEMRRLTKRIADWRKTAKGEPGTYPKQCGAIRRASLDLTRALAEFRKG